ncbi:hypothetical protein J7F02_28730 [Streptomyces sp. ISL-112]|uniref:DUF6153 family protein n=1 Tax=unclassified Streptomyces TaxID=2593676 RepID=UPI001BECFAEE|nr:MULTISPECIES: DUF6153 family protein [unclassified Streptomyces]MBT2429492.1 hypothetical protein [Streptomyces sp. ISL-112]MBT2463407.1 hypothetical protein [Streptomyces sp. ISL-63]
MASTVGGVRSGSGSVMCGQLLLLAALLFGIVTMHTVGHPAAEHVPSPSVPVAMSDAMPVAVAATASDAVHPSHRSPEHSPMSGMDPLSVCLAVLGVWGLALVGAWLLGPRTDGRPLGTPVGAGLLRAPRPNPPPPISVLASVSVLRI